MRRNAPSLLLLLSALFLFASCLKSDDDDVVYYDDTAITNFTLGTLKYTAHTKASDGSDSTFVSKIDCSGYSFNIDQQNGRIWNTDSLPVSVDITKVVATVTSKNGGLVVYQDIDSDTLFYYSSSDSIDYSQPRVFRVYNTARTVHRDYTVEVNVHKEAADSFAWHNTAVTDTFAAMKAMRGVAVGAMVYVFGQDGGQTVAYRTGAADGKTWARIAQTFDADAWQNAVAFGGRLCVLSAQTLYSSADGDSWTATTPATALRRLVGASANRLYAVTDAGRIVSSTDGATWTDDGMDTDAAWLPTADISFIVRPLKTNAGAAQLRLIGNRDVTAYPGEPYAMVWGRVEESGDGAQAQPWAYFNVTEAPVYAAPRLHNLQAVAYDNAILALGGNGEGSRSDTAFAHFYRSEDNALSWHVYDNLTLPAGFSGDGAAFAFFADNAGQIWLITAGSGQVWRGRINRLGWKSEQKAFTE